MLLPAAILLALAVITCLVFRRALRVRLGVPTRAWDLYAEVLACERDSAGFVTALVYAGDERDEASSFDSLRRWERGRGVVWERERLGGRHGLAVLGDVLFMLVDSEVRGIGLVDGRVRFHVALPSTSSTRPVIRSDSVVYFCQAGHWVRIDGSGGVLERGQAMTSDEMERLQEKGFERVSSVSDLDSDALERQLGPLTQYFAQHGPVGPLTAYWILDADEVTTTMLARQERGANTWFAYLIRLDKRGLRETRREELGELATYHGMHVGKSLVNGVLSVRLTGMREASTRGDNAVTYLVDLARGQLLGRLAHGSWICDENGRTSVRL